MKPKNKFQKEVLAQSQNLRPLTKAQEKWAFENTLTHYAHRHPQSHNATCMSCGHQWHLDTEDKECKCPHCHRTLKVEDTYRRTIRQNAYFNTLTTCGGFQVLRTFLIVAKMEKGCNASPSFTEIGSYWWNEKGDTALIAIRRTLGYYIDTFSFGSPMAIRTDNDCYRQLADQWLYPNYKAIPTLKRNGFKGMVDGISAYNLVSLLLTSPKAETLMKGNNTDMLRYMVYHEKEVERFWQSYKIAKRNGYKITDVEMWFDYLKMLDRFGKDTKSPKLITPIDLKAEHDRYMKKVNRQREIERRAADRERAKADQEKFNELKSRFFGLAFTADEFQFKTIDTIDEYYEIGNRLSICIASSRYYIKQSSLILVAYKDNEIAEVVEISLETMKVIQCHGNRNQDTENHQRIIDLANANTLPIRKRMTA